MKRHVMRVVLLVMALLVALGITGCLQKREGLQDGYYTAEVQEYNRGWKEFVTIYVSDGKIVTAEYNAKNASGLIKSWDMDYMRLMNSISGTYPNEYTRYYASELLADQGSENVDTLTGATSSHNSFKQLAEAVIEQAKKGDKSVVIVEVQTAS